MSEALHLFHKLQQSYRQKQAKKRLQQIVDERRESYECEQYRRHRAAALSYTRREA